MFLSEPEPSPERDRLYAEDIVDKGYVMNLTRAWAWNPALKDGLFTLLGEAQRAGNLSLRQRALLVTAAASGLGDSYCSFAWGVRLADETDPETATEVVRTGSAGSLPEPEAALVAWARLLATDPSGTTRADVDRLREAGYDEATILALTVYTALRIAFSTVNDALGALPDAALARSAPDALTAAIDFGRPVGD